MSQNTKSSTDKFREKANTIHNNKYNYNKSYYIKSNIPLIIVCYKHGPFKQTPNKHISGKTGCPQCANEKHKLNKSTIKKQNMDNRIMQYDINFPHIHISHNNHHFIVNCPIHNTSILKYQTTPQKWPCKQCFIDSKQLPKMSNDEYITKANKKHNNSFTYIIKNNTIYASCSNTEHQPFKLTNNIKNNHLHKKSGCTECKKQYLNNKYKHTNTTIIKLFNLTHHNTYDYKNIQYKNIHTPVDIICPLHGSFTQIPLNHIQGHNCPSCKATSGEHKILLFLNEHNIEYEFQKSFYWSINPITNRPLKYDFYLPAFNLIIEYDGEQHFEPVSFSKHDNPQQTLINTQQRDKLKNQLATSNNVNILRIPYFQLSEFLLDVTASKNIINMHN